MQGWSLLGTSSKFKFGVEIAETFFYFVRNGKIDSKLSFNIEFTL
jgi:hypothetical protein